MSRDHPDAAQCPSCLAPVSANCFESDWRTSTVLALAKGIVADSAFDRMPILGDALQDAGCTDEVIMSHCRERAEHIRTCWVLALILSHIPDATQPQQIPPPSVTRGAIALRLLDRGTDVFVLRIVPVFAVVLLVVCAVGLVFSFRMIASKQSPPTQPIAPKMDQIDWINSPFGPKPEEKIKVLTFMLNKKRADPKADPVELKRIERSHAYWVQFVESEKAKQVPASAEGKP